MIFGGAGAGLAEFVGEESTEMSLVAGFGAFIFIAAFLGIIGGIFAALRKKAGWILLAIAAAITLIAGIGMYGGMGTGMNDGFLYAIAYGMASFLAFRSCKATVSAETQPANPPMEAPVSSPVPAVMNTAALMPRAHETPMAQTSVWTCSSCEAENPPEHNFCYSCGHEREKPKPVCPQCGKEHQPGMKFCPLCGARTITAEKGGISIQPEPLERTPIGGTENRTASPPAASPNRTKGIIWLLVGIGLVGLIFFMMKAESPKKGSLTFSDGTIYKGEVVDGKANGKGLCILPNGGRYEGDVVDNQWTGKGVYITPLGDRFEGEFFQNSFSGKGKVTLRNGLTYKGEFLDALPHGYGVMIMQDGTKKKGRFEKGQYVGP